MAQPIYLDYAAATPVAPQVIAAMQPYFSANFYNPSATYLAAKAVKKDVDTARAAVAQVLGARHTEIIFTAGGTEANNLAISGVLEHFPSSSIITSTIEHESVLLSAGKYTHREVDVSSDGIVDPKQLVELIDDTTVLVSVMYANNEIGTIQPVRAIAQLIRDIRRARELSGNDRPLYLHTDAAQAGNYLDLHVSRLGIDLMTLNGGKLYGPKASGALYIASHVRLSPQIVGGGQERGMRSGTENVPAIIGFARALELAQQLRPAEAKRLLSLQHQFIQELTEQIPGILINGSQKLRLPNNVHVTIAETDNERVLFELDEAGIQAAAGSACSASNEEPSHVLRAIGLSDEQAQSSLRFSLGRATTTAEIRKTVRILSRLVA